MIKGISTKSILLQFLLLSFIAVNSVMAQTAERFPLTGPLGFIENKGQFRDQKSQQREDLLYMYIRDGLKVQLMPNAISFDLFTMEEDPESISESKGFAESKNLDPDDAPVPLINYKVSRIDIQFIGANPNPQIVAEELLPDYLNYYVSYAPKGGLQNVRQYNKVTYKNLYNNIDMVMIASPEDYPSRALAYDFVVHPGGNVNDIRYRYNGSNNQQLLANGTLETSASLGRIFEMIPESYLQNEQGNKVMPVNVSFKKEKDFISFDVPLYDTKQSLVIDPVLIWATYCGGLYSDEVRGLAVDSEDHVIITGRTYSTDGIATTGAYQTEIQGEIDVLIEKYNDKGERLWGTYYGGQGLDRARACIVTPAEDIYIGAHTTSTEGCVTEFAYQKEFKGVEDGLLAFFTKDGALGWATYYGGEDEEVIRRLHLDTEGNVIMCGYSLSDTGVATPDAWQTENHGSSDLCLSKWTAGGDLIWSTYLGGESEDHGRSVISDKFNNIYINGSTGSQFGIKKNAFRDHNAGGQDYLLAKYNPNGGLKWASYWGGTEEDRGRGVFTDPTGEFVYFIGYSASDTGVALPGAFQGTLTEGYDGQGLPYHDAVIMKWSTDGYPIWSTYIGGAPDDRGRAVTMIDNDVYLGGTTSSTDVIATADGFQTTFGGKEDMFLEKFNESGDRIWGSYFGGDDTESALALAIDQEKMHIFMVGTAESLGLGTPGVAQETFGGYDDGFLLKVKVGYGVSVNDPETTSAMSIYPNPSQGAFEMKYNIKETATLIIYDLSGAVVYTKPLSVASQQVKVTDLKLIPGIYEVIINSGDNEIASKKLVIVK